MNEQEAIKFTGQKRTHRGGNSANRGDREKLPPEKLMQILMRIYPEYLAVELFEKLTGEEAERKKE